MDELGRRTKKIEPPDPNQWTEQLDDVKVFDQLIYNTDRNQGNLLIGKDWTLYMIDHSRAFREHHTLKDPKVLRRISERLLKALRSLDRTQVAARLVPFVSQAAVDALMARRDLIVRYFEGQITEKGREAVLTGIERGPVRATIP
jgi:hypothetical protein